jgi:hypothetical protein
VDERLVEPTPGAVPVDILERGLAAEVGLAQAPEQLALLTVRPLGVDQEAVTIFEGELGELKMPSCRWNASAMAGSRKVLSLSTVARWARCCSYFSRRISRTCLIDTLSVVSVGGLLSVAPPYRAVGRPMSDQARNRRSGSPERVITIRRNPRSGWIGTSDRDPSEQAIRIGRNHQGAMNAPFSLS